VIILEKQTEEVVFIDTWLMSCRVLKRGMEKFVLNTIIETAQKNGFKKVKAEYIPTPKNEMVKDHYQNLGFNKEEAFWIMDVNDYTFSTNYITTK
jgi:predicted enzyme involved in methoxymalonyl-ACP biosynthesis